MDLEYQPPLSHFSSRPTSIDLSGVFAGNGDAATPTTLKVVEFADRTLIFVTNLNGRIGHIVEVGFPAMYQAISANLMRHRAEHFEMRTLLGPDVDDYDLFVTRVAKSLVKYGRVRRPTWLMLGLESVRDIDYLRQILQRIDDHFAGSQEKARFESADE